MLDRFLTSVLEVIIVLDLLGIIAYFVLGGLRSKNSAAERTAKDPSSKAPPFWQRLPWRRSQPVGETMPLPDATQSFSRVLYSFEQGLS